MPVKSHKVNLGLDLKELKTFQLTPVPYSLGTVDNLPTKTDKSSDLQWLTKGVENANVIPVKDTMTVVDGNAVFHVMSQVPSTYQEITLQAFDMIPKSTDCVISTDMYHAGSVK